MDELLTIIIGSANMSCTNSRQIKTMEKKISRNRFGANLAIMCLAIGLMTQAKEIEKLKDRLSPTDAVKCEREE